MLSLRGASSGVYLKSLFAVYHGPECHETQWIFRDFDSKAFEACYKTQGVIFTVMDMKTIDESITIGQEKKSCYTCASGTYFTLHDFQGRCLITRAPSDAEQLIDLNELPPGEYIITISGKNAVQSHKIVIQNKS